MADAVSRITDYLVSGRSFIQGLLQFGDDRNQPWSICATTALIVLVSKVENIEKSVGWQKGGQKHIVISDNPIPTVLLVFVSSPSARARPFTNAPNLIVWRFQDANGLYFILWAVSYEGPSSRPYYLKLLVPVLLLPISSGYLITKTHVLHIPGFKFAYRTKYIG